MGDRDARGYSVAPLLEGGARVDGAAPAWVARVETDSRAAGDGALFVALRGERFDGHDFVAGAEAAGAAGAVVEAARLEGLRAGGVRMPLLGVADTRAAFGARVVAVAGSNGKTTTKALLVGVLEQAGPTLSTRANHNNEVGVPQTLLRLRPEHRFAVVEVGTNAPGEVARLTALVAPDVGVLTNVQAEHLEGFGDLAGVLEEETALYAAMGAEGVCVAPVDDELVWGHARLEGRRVVGYGWGEAARVRVVALEGLGAAGQRVVFACEGRRLEVRLALLGRHNAHNAAAVVASARALGVDLEVIGAGLEAATPVTQRMQPLEVRGRLVINDAYNANPGSMVAALASLPALGGARRRWVAVLGEMRELGASAAREHEALGARAARAGLSALYGFGAATEAMAARARAADPALAVAWGADASEAARFAARHARRGDGVLLKGSRGVRLERVLAQLEAAFDAADEASS